jgi:hypothetical protein
MAQPDTQTVELIPAGTHVQVDADNRPTWVGRVREAEVRRDSTGHVHTLYYVDQRDTTGAYYPPSALTRVERP